MVIKFLYAIITIAEYIMFYIKPGQVSTNMTALLSVRRKQFVIFKPLSYCFEETIGFDVKASFASRPVSRLLR